MTTGQKGTRSGTPQKRNEVKREKALAELAKGESVKAVAASLKVKRDTVASWRDSADGQRYLAEARTKRAADLANAARLAKQLLEDNATRAAQVLVDAMGSEAPTVRVMAARSLLDRVGVPVGREGRATITPGDGPDLSRLTTEQLVTFDELMRRARGEA